MRIMPIDSGARITFQDYLTKIYRWMALGLFITGLVSYTIASSPLLASLIYGNTFIFILLLIVEVTAVTLLAARVDRLSDGTARIIFIFYSLTNGITLSAVFTAYTDGSIASTFFATCLVFAAMSLYGYFTGTDLTRIGNITLMGLLGVVVASVMNIFLHNSAVEQATVVIGVIVFVALVAVDTQKLKNLANGEAEWNAKRAIVGALTLYLDLVNLFILLLRLFGRRRNDW